MCRLVFGRKCTQIFESTKRLGILRFNFFEIMTCIKYFDIKMEKEVYCAGDTIHGHVILENFDDIKVTVILRGKACAEWKVTRSGERRAVRDDQYLLDDQVVIWGKDKNGDEPVLSENDQCISILHQGMHQFPFKFNLPQMALPCSFESKSGTIRYFVKVIVDVLFASSPQGVKYFTVIGPRIDCSDEKYLTPMVGQDKKTVCCFCCRGGPVGLRVTLERTAYVCGENLRLLAIIENQSEQTACVKIKLLQHVEYFIDKGVLGINKHLCHTVFESRSPKVAPFSRGKYDSIVEQPIKLQVVPPTLIGVCRLIQIYYGLKACLELEKSGDMLDIDFPLTVATVPLQVGGCGNARKIDVDYDFCSSHVEGGMYISPEFQLGQINDGSMPSLEPGTLINGKKPGTSTEPEVAPLYRPLYSKIPDKKT